MQKPMKRRAFLKTVAIAPVALMAENIRTIITIPSLPCNYNAKQLRDDLIWREIDAAFHCSTSDMPPIDLSSLRVS